MKKYLLGGLTAGLSLVPMVALQAFDTWPAGNLIRGEDSVFIDYKAHIQTSPDDTDLIDIELVDGKMLVDTRDYYQAHPQGRVFLYCNNFAEEEYTVGKRHRIVAEVQSEPPAPFGLFFNGEDACEGGKHFWREEKFMAAPQSREYSIEAALPATLKNVCMRLDMNAPAVYELGAFRIELVLPPDYDKFKENIINGGAERGYYGTMAPSMDQISFSKDGKYHDWGDRKFDNALKVTIDPREHMSGRNSFRVDTGDKSCGSFSLAPVPVIPGEPVTLSFWAKANEDARIEACYYICSGSAYAKAFRIDKEWKRYELTVPVWGEKAEGVSDYGNPGKSYGDLYNLVFPRFDFPDNVTVWLDDISCRNSTETIFVDDSPFWVSGRVDAVRGYVFAGTPVVADLQVLPSGSQQKTAEISYKLVDFSGNVLLQSPPRSVSLPHYESFRMVPPEGARGYMEWVFSVAAPDGGSVEHTFPIGVIDAPRKKLERIGMNASKSSWSNVTRLIPYLEDFRIGAVRLWSFSDCSAFDDVPFYKKAGFYVLMALNDMSCISQNPRVHHFLPVDYARWSEVIGGRVRSVKGLVDAYETINEPNIWIGQSQNPDSRQWKDATPEEVVRCIKETAAIIEREDPDAKLAGPTSCGTVSSYIATILSMGTADLYDIITEHPYRQLPELPDYQEDIEALKRAVKPYGDYRFFSSESGRVYPGRFPENRIFDAVRRNVARDLRNMLVGYASGVDKYFHFSLPGGPLHGETCWQVLFPGNGDNDYNFVPNPLLFAIRAMADRIEDGEFYGRVPAGVNSRCYLLDRTDKRVAVLWKWNGDPEKVVLPADMTVYDMMGNKVKEREVMLGEFPYYLESDLPRDQFEKVISEISFEDAGEALEISLKTTGERNFEVILHNLSSRTLDGTLTIVTPGAVKGEAVCKFERLAPEAAAALPFEAAEAIGIEPRQLQIKYDIPALNRTVVADKQLKGMTLHYVGQSPEIDGDAADWEGVAPLLLDGAKSFVPSAGVSPEAGKDIRVEFRGRWNEKGLYMFITVYKPEFNPEKESAHMIWRGDSLQLAFDPIANAPVGFCGYQDDDFEYSFGMVGDRLSKLRHYASASTYDSLFKPIGEIDDVDCAVKVGEGRVDYELWFSPLSVSPLRLREGSSGRFDFIANLNDGKERIGWIELTPGIGQDPKSPSEFCDITLTK